MPVITIRGQLGSGAEWIGRMLAQRIGGEYVDREVIAEVASRTGAPSYAVQTKEEPPVTLLGRIEEALTKGAECGPDGACVWLPSWEAPLDNRRYLDALSVVIRELAKSPSIVIRGRGSQFILKDHPEAIHALVVAPPEVRLKRVMLTSQLLESEAREEIALHDKGRREFIRRFFGADVEDPVHYDVVVNTHRLSFEDSAEVILDALGRIHKA